MVVPTPDDVVVWQPAVGLVVVFTQCSLGNAYDLGMG